MRRITYIILAAILCCLPACKKTTKLSSEYLDLTVNLVQATQAWYEVIPQTNDYFYATAVLTKKQIDSLGTDDAIIQFIEKSQRERYAYLEKNWKELLGDDFPTYEYLFFAKGAYITCESELEQNADYCVCAYPYDKKENPSKFLSKQYFTTKTEFQTNLHFILTAQGDSIFIAPSSDDTTYVWTYTTKTDINTQSYGYEDLYFYQIVTYCEQYDLMKGYLTKGPDASDVYLDLNDPIVDGDTIFAFAESYNIELNGPAFKWRLVYHEGKDWEVEGPKNLYEEKFSPAKMAETKRLAKFLQK